MPSVLARVARALSLGGPEAKEMVRKVGSGYLRLAKDTPGFFETGISPGKTLEEIAQKYKLDPIRSDKRDMVINPLGRPNNSLEVVIDRGDRVRKFKNNPGTDGLRDYITPDKGYALNDATSLEEGSGVGRQLYPALFDALMSQDRGMYTTHLTPINAIKRNYNSIGSTIRHENGMPDMFVHPDQLLYSGGITPADFAMMSPEEKVGQYLINGGLGMKTRQATRQSNWERAINQGDDSNADAMMSLMRLNFRPGQGQWGGVTAQSDPSNFNDLVQGLRQSGITDMGSGTLRKIMITDALSRGEPINPELLQNLEYRDGGQVTPLVPQKPR